MKWVSMAMVVGLIATTVVGFLPVFALDGPEGKLFKPLAYTKTFALVAAVLIALVAIPPLANLIFAGRLRRAWIRDSLAFGTLAVGAVLLELLGWRSVFAFLTVYGVGAAAITAPPRMHQSHPDRKEPDPSRREADLSQCNGSPRRTFSEVRKRTNGARRGITFGLFFHLFSDI